MSVRVGSALSDANIRLLCPEMFSIPNKHALQMILQPDENYRALEGVKKEKYLRIPPRPKNFNTMAVNLARNYAVNEGISPVVANLTVQYKQDVKQAVRLPGVSIIQPKLPNRPNVLYKNVDLNQVLLELAAQVQQLGVDYAQQRNLNDIAVAALQEARAAGTASQQQIAQLELAIRGHETEMDLGAAREYWGDKPSAEQEKLYATLLKDAQALYGNDPQDLQDLNFATPSAFKVLGRAGRSAELVRIMEKTEANLQTGEIDGGMSRAGTGIGKSLVVGKGGLAQMGIPQASGISVSFAEAKTKSDPGTVSHSKVLKAMSSGSGASGSGDFGAPPSGYEPFRGSPTSESTF